MRRVVHTSIVDACALFREGLARILSATHFRIVASLQSLDDFPANLATDRGDSLILIGLDEDSSAVLAQLPLFKARHMHMRVVMLSDRFDPEEVLKAINSGADGYLLKKQVSPDALLKSLDLVLQGETILPQCFIQLIKARLCSQIELPVPDNDHEPSVEMLPRQSAARASESDEPLRLSDEPLRLSDKEQLILRHLTQGASNKHIARDLHIAEATVKVHVKAILRKIRVRNRTQAAMWAVNNRVPAAGGQQ